MQLLWHYKDLFTDIRFLMQVVPTIVLFILFFIITFLLLPFMQVIAVVISIILGCMVIDSMFYGEFTIAPINFFIINVVEKKAVYFGVKPWHFTLTEVCLNKFTNIFSLETDTIVFFCLL
ncbi:hypothetical protein EON65_09020 [archaeon]|nr:MAG: hypothetical protein EON65_09020 [archaeon]